MTPSDSTNLTGKDEQLAESAVGGRVRRLIRLVNLVYTGMARSAGELSAELGVTKRTIFRDIRILQDAGVDINSRPGGGYSMSNRFMIPTQSLSGQEMVGLMLLAKVVAETPESEPMRAAGDVVRRIIAQMPGEERRACEREAQKHLARLGLAEDDDPR